MARAVGYFKPIKGTSPTMPRVSFSQVVGVFFIYLATLVMLGGGIAKALNFLLSAVLPRNTVASPMYAQMLSSGVQLFTTCLVAYLLYFFSKAQKDRASILAIWKDPSGDSSIIKDIGMGAVSWIVSFPFITLVGEVFDFLIYLIFGNQQYEQVAVRYLKMSIGSSVLFGIALFTVVIAAPFIEELLFRGFLQNFFKRYLGKMAAIILTAASFALFHFSLSQDLGNIPLVASLFTLALFLGYIYERQRSLFASIALHMTFNAVSIIRILTNPE